MNIIPAGYYELEPENNIFQDVIVDVTHRCNMTCKNCYIPNRSIPDMDIDRMISAISKFPKRTMIRIIGAEPTMRKDLPEIIHRIKKSGHRCTLLTNGLRLANNQYVKNLKSHGLGHCYISMNGADNDDWYEAIDEMRCAKKKVSALENLVNNRFIIDVGTIIVRDINDEVIGRSLKLFNNVNLHNVVFRIKNIGYIGRIMSSNVKNYSESEIIDLICNQTGISKDYVYEWKSRPMYQNTEPEYDNFMFPLVPPDPNKPLHRSGVWFKIASWGGVNGDNNDVPLPSSTRRGRLTQEFKVAPFMEHVKINEGGY